MLILRVQLLILICLEDFGELPPPVSYDKRVQMHLKLKPEFVGHMTHRRPYPAPKEQAHEIHRQIQECRDAGLVNQYKDEDNPQNCSPCFVVAKPGSSAKQLVVDYEEEKKSILNYSGSLPNTGTTLENIASCDYRQRWIRGVGSGKWT